MSESELPGDKDPGLWGAGTPFTFMSPSEGLRFDGTSYIFVVYYVLVNIETPTTMGLFGQRICENPKAGLCDEEILGYKTNLF